MRIISEPRLGATDFQLFEIALVCNGLERLTRGGSGVDKWHRRWAKDVHGAGCRSEGVWNVCRDSTRSGSLLAIPVSGCVVQRGKETQSSVSEE
jgi:hypothetical protein